MQEAIAVPVGSSAGSLFSRSYRAWLLFILGLTIAFNLVDRQTLGVAGQAIKLDLGLSDARMGLIQGLAFAIFYSVLALPIARRDPGVFDTTGAAARYVRCAGQRGRRRPLTPFHDRGFETPPVQAIGSPPAGGMRAGGDFNEWHRAVLRAVHRPQLPRRLCRGRPCPVVRCRRRDALRNAVGRIRGGLGRAPRPALVHVGALPRRGCVMRSS
jgi:hypothetical protein